MLGEPEVEYERLWDDWVGLRGDRSAALQRLAQRVTDGSGGVIKASVSQLGDSAHLGERLKEMIRPPLIIDRPEDDRDNQVVQDVAEAIWGAKTRRQLISASHNANLVVNGDAERVVVFDYRVIGDSSGGTIATQGAIDVKPTREAMKGVLEGGEEAFKLRRDKYGF